MLLVENSTTCRTSTWNHDFSTFLSQAFDQFDNYPLSDSDLRQSIAVSKRNLICSHTIFLHYFVENLEITIESVSITLHLLHLFGAWISNQFLLCMATFYCK
jgi:hypothetical protein